MNAQQFTEEAKEARQCVKVADHMLTVTFPLVKDTKLLLAIVENLFLAMEHSLAAFLYNERFYGRVPSFSRSTESMLNVYMEKVVGADKEVVSTIHELQNLIEAHKSSALEFSRDQKLVMATEKFNLKTITPDDLKEILTKVKQHSQELLKKVEP